MALTLTQMWNVGPPQLPAPSDEQRAIVEAVRGHACVRIIAYAGTGKSTCAMMVVVQDHKTNTILTYNRSLADETNDMIKRLGLSNVVCHTYHSQVGIAAGLRGEINTDTKLNHQLQLWDNDLAVVHPIKTDRVFIDEVQDMRPTFYRSVVHMIKQRCPQLITMGDEKQMLYDYVKDDAAHTGYLLRPHEYFSEVSSGRDWAYQTLSISYRLTPKVTEFVNQLWDTRIVSGNTRSDLPVEYWCLSMYAPRLLKRLRAILHRYKPEDIALLNPTNMYSKNGKERPLMTAINRLLMDKHNGQRRYNFAIKKPDAGTSSYENKIRAWTHNASKGSTIKVTIVFGFSAYKGVQPSTNRLGVAISRSNHRLIVVHECDREKCGRERPHPYVARFNSKVLEDMVERGVVVAPDGIPEDIHETPEEPTPKMISVSDITHLSAVTMGRLNAFGQTIEHVPPQHNIAVSFVHKFHTGMHHTEEDVSSIYGVAIPFAMEYARKCSIQLVESMLSNAILVTASAMYTPDDVVAAIQKILPDLSLEDCNRIRASFSWDRTRGNLVIDRLRDLRRQMRALNDICVSDRHRFDRIFAEFHLKRVKTIYAKEDKTPADFMYLANACMAVENTHELFVQIGDDYDWVDGDAFESAVHALLKSVPSGEHERNVCAPVEPPVCGTRQSVNAIAGAIDVLCDNDIVYELKFVRELGIEHEVQSLLYAAMMTQETGVMGRCVLYNARTGEKITKEIAPSQALPLLREAAICKVGL